MEHGDIGTQMVGIFFSFLFYFTHFSHIMAKNV